MHRVNKTKQNTGTADQSYGPHVLPLPAHTWQIQPARQASGWTSGHPSKHGEEALPPHLLLKEKGHPEQEDRNTHYAHATLYQEESGSVNWPQIPK